MNMENRSLGLVAWVTAGIVAVVAGFIGFVWLPSLQASEQGGLWNAICRAVGIARPTQAMTAASPAQVPTDLVWDAKTLRVATSGDAQRGAALAAGCAGCHGERGISPADTFPNLAGLPAEVLYKQLRDYRSGKRENPIMQSMAAALDETKIADLASHFAALPTAPSSGSDTAPALVVTGSPMRSLAPCAACHGPLGRKHGAPPLPGQKTAYLKAQLDAFASGTRHNDVDQQMREIARALSAPERQALAEWYGERHQQ